MSTLKPQSNGPLYSNMMIGTLAVNGWAVTFGTARRVLGGLRPRQYAPRQSTHQRPAYQLYIVRCGTIISFAHYKGLSLVGRIGSGPRNSDSFQFFALRMLLHFTGVTSWKFYIENNLRGIFPGVFRGGIFPGGVCPGGFMSWNHSALVTHNLSRVSATLANM